MTGSLPQGRGDAEALRIYQQRLDTLARTVLDGDYAATPDFFNLPTQFRTLRAELVIEDAADVVENYRGFHADQVSRGLTDLLWLASDARWLSPDYIEGFHVTHLMRGTTPLYPPYQNRTVLKNVGGVWKVDEFETALSNTKFPLDHLMVRNGTGVDPQVFASPAQDARSVVADPLTIYRRFLEDYSACNMAGDFAGWSAMHLYPHTIHTEAVDRTIKAPDGIRAFFDMLTQIIRDNGADRLERAPSRAEFLSANKICGYHIGRILRGDEIVLGPIKSRMILQRVGPTWFLRSVTNSVANDVFPYQKPIVSAELIGLRDIQSRKRP